MIICFLALDDVNAIHQLIIELAVYEKEPEAVKTTPEQLLEDGFGENPFYQVFVAESSRPSGMSAIQTIENNRHICKLLETLTVYR